MEFVDQLLSQRPDSGYPQGIGWFPPQDGQILSSSPSHNIKKLRVYTPPVMLRQSVARFIYHVPFPSEIHFPVISVHGERERPFV